MSNRREFMMQVSLGGGVVLAGNAVAQGAMVAESEAQAAALGYKADASKVDKAKFPKFASGQLAKSAATARFTRVRLLTPLLAAPCLPVSKWRARAGAVPTPRRPDPVSLV